MDRKQLLFTSAAQSRQCKSERARGSITKGIEDLNDAYRKNPLFPIPRLRKIIEDSGENGLIRDVLRCRCKVCVDNTNTTDPTDDKSLSYQFIYDDKKLQLFTALCWIACTFTLRSLNTLQLHTIDAVLHKLDAITGDVQPELGDIIGLFRPIAEEYPTECTHTPLHGDTLEDRQLCLLHLFGDCLRHVKWLFDTPKFTTHLNQPSSPLWLVDELNLPFLEQIEIRCTASKDNSFFHFKMEPSFWELEEGQSKKNDRLFRKQIRLPPTEKNTVEEVVLRYISRMQDRNIARLLFSYSHSRHNSIYSNLVFKYYPLDLSKILNPLDSLNSDPTLHSLEKNALKKFLSTLEDALPLQKNLLWQGVLDIVKAVRQLHELMSPENDSSGDKFIGAHFDIKPANILVGDDAWTFILNDFGQSRLKRLSRDEKDDITATSGTVDYRPPKSINGETKLTLEYDIWSLACVLTEALVFIFSGTRHDSDLEIREDVVEFRNERRQESGLEAVTSANFWKYEGNIDRKVVLKRCVRTRLDRLKSFHQDAYLNKCVDTISRMFSTGIDRTRMAARDCFDLLADIPYVDSSLLVSSNAKLIAGPGTRFSFEAIHVTVRFDKGSFPCKISLWIDEKNEEYTMTLEINGKEKNAILKDKFKRSWEQIIPLSLYEQSNSPNRVGFRYSHDGRELLFYNQSHMKRFFGAITKHYPRETFFSVSCVLVLGLSRKKTFRQGCIHILQELRPSRYADFYTKLYSGEEENPQRKLIWFRLAFYCSDGAKFCWIISLANMVLNTKKQEPNQVVFEHKEKSSFEVAFIETPKPPSENASKPLRESYFNDYPGFPIGPPRIRHEIENGKKAQSLTLTFENHQERKRFQEKFAGLYENDV